MVLKLCNQHVNLGQVVTYRVDGRFVYVGVASGVELNLQAKDNEQATAMVLGLDNYFGGLFDPLANKTYERKRKSGT